VNTKYQGLEPCTGRTARWPPRAGPGLVTLFNKIFSQLCVKAHIGLMVLAAGIPRSFKSGLTYEHHIRTDISGVKTPVLTKFCCFITYSFRFHSTSFHSCQFERYLTFVYELIATYLFHFLGTINHLNFTLLFVFQIGCFGPQDPQCVSFQRGQWACAQCRWTDNNWAAHLTEAGHRGHILFLHSNLAFVYYWTNNDIINKIEASLCMSCLTCNCCEPATAVSWQGSNY